MTKIAVVGAGLSGLVVAQRLQSVADVTVFEKSGGAGGRMATRYAGKFEFDHGAQFFTARTAAFRSFLKPLIEDGVVGEWNATFAELDRSSITSMRTWDREFPHYVGTPRMNDIGKALSAGLNVALGSTVTSIDRNQDGWTLSVSDGQASGPYDWLVITAPAAQTGSLAEAYPELAAYCRERRMLGCYAMMLGFAEPIDLPWQAALVRNADVSWVSVNSSKPGRAEPFTLLVHSTNAWADAHLDDDAEDVLQHMLDEASSVMGVDLRRARHRQVQRWRYANIPKQRGPEYFIDDNSKVATCGDWCIRGRVEAAFTSGSNLAATLLDKIQQERLASNSQ